ncbi:hypothetical protein AKJ09_05691 [Labilithrix luteola]|uniref:Uncharacterized protein n=1 Tax=Labilithrix luteola TaxID=1391654 RepID=A0A0K1PZV7_9BACT|nr:hypothetical protein [Labilithrix luteola]AKU99027.1 hypothetical protein AKJ09_05691 [Labilithrix luteola]
MYLEDSRLSKERKALALLNADIERLEQELAKKKNDYWQRVAALGPKVSPAEKSATAEKSTESEMELAEAAPVAKPAEAERAPKPSKKASRKEPEATEEEETEEAEEEETDPMLEELLEVVRGRKEGLRAEDIRTELGWEKSELKRVVDAALESGQLSKKGDRRSTTYHAR